MQAEPQVPVTVLTGFLGAGKTTLLNRILKEQHGHRIAVIENEFGPEGIDNEILVEETREQIVEMNNGCICCTVRGDLIVALTNLAQKRAAGEIAFDRVVIETTGLANPGPVAQTFFVDEEVGANYMLDAVVTVVDARHAMDQLDRSSGASVDWLTVIESRLFDQKIKQTLVPTEEPVAGGRIGSPFGFRIDPITGRSALHTGLDFPADTGTPIVAAAGGVVVVQDVHPAYGNMVEIDHGNNLITRYAHASKVDVTKGDIVKRGQKIAEVGSTGRSTGPHLHFEVWVSGVVQDPSRFLAAGETLAAAESRPARPPRKP